MADKEKTQTHQLHIRIAEPSWQKLRLTSIVKKQSIQDLLVDYGVEPLLRRFPELSLHGAGTVVNRAQEGEGR